MGWQDDPLAYSVDANTQKFLDFIGKAEGADYNTIVGGGKFNSYAQHPNVVGARTSEGPSTAAGKYQIVGSTYKDVAPKIGVTDFSPESQDRIAVELIKRAGALEDVQKGDYQAAIKKLGPTWASLPSSPYSQPKRSQNWVESALDMVVSPAQAAQSKGGWMDDPVVGEEAPAPKAAPKATKGGWMDDPVVGEAPPKQAPKSVPQGAPTAPAKKEDKSWLRTIDDAVRGAADTLTFGYADEIAAKLDQLTGGGQSGKKTYDEALKAQRQRDAEGGGARIAGQVAGALVPGAGVLGAIRAPANATRLGRAAAGAGTGAVQGALYGSGSAEGDLGDRAQGALTGGAIGGATGGILGGLMPSTAGQVATQFQKKAGDPSSAAVDAEIIRDLNAIAKNESNRGNPVQAVQANNLEQKYVTDATRAIKQLGKDGLQKTGLTTDDIQAAVQNRRILTADELDKLRGSAAGDALADAIDKAQRTRSMTAPVNASDNPLTRIGRATLNVLPLPQSVHHAGQRILGSRSTREDQIQKLIGDKNAKAADILAERVGPSAATQSLDKLQGQVTTAQKAAEARAQLIAQQKAQAAAQNEANKIGVLQDTRVPLGGGFQELLQGGRSNLNLQSKEAIDALRLAKRRFGSDSPIGQAADQTLKSQPVKDENAFYGLQNWLRKTQENGALAGGPQPGVLSGVNPVRNPIAYQANVDNAMGALKNASDNAPNQALAQFARKVAGTKDIAAKEKMIADRLGKASPEEAAFLEQFVSPLTQFGKK